MSVLPTGARRRRRGEVIESLQVSGAIGGWQNFARLCSRPLSDPWNSWSSEVRGDALGCPSGSFPRFCASRFPDSSSIASLLFSAWPSFWMFSPFSSCASLTSAMSGVKLASPGKDMLVSIVNVKPERWVRRQTLRQSIFHASVRNNLVLRSWYGVGAYASMPPGDAHQDLVRFGPVSVGFGPERLDENIDIKMVRVRLAQ